MKDIRQIAVIVQARLSSQRVPSKMIKPFAGTTLIEIALAKIKTSKVIQLDQFHLAVHEQELIDIGLKYGVKVFQRSDTSANSEGESMKELYEWWDKTNHDYCVLINACAPFLSIETIDDFVESYLRTNSDGLFGVIAKKNYFWNDQKKLLTPWPEGYQVMNTKLVGVTYEAAHCLYAGRMDKIGQGTWMGTFQKPNDPELYPMKEEEALDIDYAWQFDMCQALYTARSRRAE